MNAAGDSEVLVAGRGLSKRFGAVEALSDVSFALHRGEVLALLGDNGAGKSTLIKIITGLHPPDRGELVWEGQQVRFHSPRDAYDLGIATVYQDLAIVDSLSIYRNLFLGREDAITRRFGPIHRLDHKRAKREARSLLAELGITIRSADETVEKLSGGERQAIAIARGVRFSAKLLILDEPTSALGLKQAAQVLYSIEQARAKGLAVIVISHNVHHVYPVADRFLILSHGRALAEFRRGERTQEEVAELIVQGRLLVQELRRVETAGEA